jgi:murein DD-endopeptidase MepM/ murein hydrolase activator NlpD
LGYAVLRRISFAFAFVALICTLTIESGGSLAATVSTTTILPSTTKSGPRVTVYALHQIKTTTYRRPTNRSISDPWRPPANPYAAGNRGIEFATVAGDQVLIAAAGSVTFAGNVAGTYYLVVLHPDGIRTTLGGLTGSPFRIGDNVARGQVAGTASGPIHFGARYGDLYIDPTPLLGKASGPPWLTKTSKE